MSSRFDRRATIRASHRPILYMFRSEKSDGLNAFAATASGTSLPEKFAPWIRTGSVMPSGAPPFGLSRSAIETGISASSLSRIERYKQTPLIGAAQKIIKFSKNALRPEDFFA